MISDTEARLTDLIDKLRKHGYRITPQRRAVIEILLNNADHPSADLIYARVRERFPMTSLATVYKTIALLREMGEIYELGFSDSTNRFDASRPYPHAHMICIRCGRIGDLDVEMAEEELISKIARETGYDIVWHRSDFFGVCPDCQGESDTPVKETGQ